MIFAAGRQTASTRINRNRLDARDAERELMRIKYRQMDRTTAELAFGQTAFKKHACSDRKGGFIFFFAVALNNISDHQGHHFNHGDETRLRAARNIRIDNSHYPLVFGIRRYNRDDGVGVTGVISAGNRIEIDDFAYDRRVIVMVLFRRQAEDGKITLVKSGKPCFLAGAQHFLIIEKFSLDKKTGCFGKGSEEHSGIGWRNNGLRIMRGGTILPVADFSFKHFLQRVEFIRRINTFSRAYLQNRLQIQTVFYFLGQDALVVDIA